MSELTTKQEGALPRPGRIVRPPEARKRGLPEVGRFACGMKAVNAEGQEYAKGLDYFVPRGKYASLFTKAFGEKPDSLMVTFHSDDFESVCFERYECRDKQGRLVASGNGQDFSVWERRGKGGVYIDVKHGDPRLFDIGQWRTALTLRVILPDIPGVLGYWQITTYGAESSIPEIRDTFDFVLEYAGRVSMIPFDLSVKFAQSQAPGSKSKYPVMTLTPNLSQQNLESIAQLVQGGEKIRGLLTEDKLRALLPEPEAKKEKPLAITAQSVQAREPEPVTPEYQPPTPIPHPDGDPVQKCKNDIKLYRGHLDKLNELGPGIEYLHFQNEISDEQAKALFALLDRAIKEAQGAKPQRNGRRRNVVHDSGGELFPAGGGQ